MTLNFAAMLGIYKDVSMSHDEFGLAGSLYYLAQLIFQVGTIMEKKWKTGALRNAILYKDYN